MNFKMYYFSLVPSNFKMFLIKIMAAYPSKVLRSHPAQKGNTPPSLFFKGAGGKENPLLLYFGF